MDELLLLKGALPLGQVFHFLYQDNLFSSQCATSPVVKTKTLSQVVSSTVETPPALARLLDTVFVLPPVPITVLQSSFQSHPTPPLHDIISSCIHKLLVKGSACSEFKRPLQNGTHLYTNVLAWGSRLDDGLRLFTFAPNQWLNQMSMQSEWQNLVDIVGTEAMVSLLTTRQVFVQLNGVKSQSIGSMIQIAGSPLVVSSKVTGKAYCNDEISRRGMRSKVNRISSLHFLTLQNQFIVRRVLMLYSKSKIDAKTDRVRQPRLYSRQLTKSKQKNGCISKGIVPAPLKAILLSDLGIGKSCNAKLNKLELFLINLCKHVIDKFNKFPIQELLDHYCPLYEPNEWNMPRGTLLSIKRLLSFEKHPVNSSLINKKVSKIGVLSKNGHQRMIVGSCDTRLIVKFLMRLIRKLIPKHLMVLAYSKNLQRLLISLVEMRKFEALYVKHQMLYKLKALPWLYSLPFKSRHEHEQSKTAVLAFTTWLCEHVLLKGVLQRYFYVTEAGDTKHKLYFFRHEAWQELTKETTRALIENQFEPSPVGQPACPFRLLPKKIKSMNEEDGNGSLSFPQISFRPIINLNKQILFEGGKRVVTSPADGRLQDILAILQWHLNLPDMAPYSVHGLGDVDARLNSFRNRHSPRSTFYYMVKADVDKCFDSLPHGPLLDVLHAVLHPVTYVIKTFDILSKDSISERLFTKSIRKAFPLGSFPSCHELHSILADRFPKKCLILDRVEYQTIDYDRVWHILHSHITSTYVYIDGKHWRLRRGIPQGSCLSAALCSLYFGHMDRIVFSRVGELPGTLLMRYCDDFWMVTMYKAVAQEFVQLLSYYRGTLLERSFGIKFHTSKLVTNFSSNRCINRPLSFPWLGMLIDDHTLMPVHDYDHDHSLNIHALTIIPSINSLRSHLKRFARVRMHPIFRTAHRKMLQLEIKRAIMERAKLYIRELKRCYPGVIVDKDDKIVQDVAKDMSTWVDEQLGILVIKKKEGQMINDR